MSYMDFVQLNVIWQKSGINKAYCEKLTNLLNQLEYIPWGKNKNLAQYIVIKFELNTATGAQVFARRSQYIWDMISKCTSEFAGYASQKTPPVNAQDSLSIAENQALAIFNLDKRASIDDIRRQYRILAQQYHPDRPGGDMKKMKQLNAAYQVLTSTRV